MHVAAGRLGQREARGGRVADVVQVDRLALVGAGNALDREVEPPADRDGAAHAAALDLDRLGLRAGELADQRAERCLRPRALAARNRREGLALLLRRAFIEDEADRPVALDHRAWCVQQDGEAETVEPGAPVLPALDVEHEPRVARSLRRPCRQARGRTGTHRIAVARLEVLTADLPLNVRHHQPPLTVRAPVTSRTRAGPWPDRAGEPRSRPAPPARRRSFAQSTRRGAGVFRPRPRTR